MLIVLNKLCLELGKSKTAVAGRLRKLVSKTQFSRLTKEEINSLVNESVTYPEKSPSQICHELKIDTGLGRYHVEKARKARKTTKEK